MRNFYQFSPEIPCASSQNTTAIAFASSKEQPKHYCNCLCVNVKEEESVGSNQKDGGDITLKRDFEKLGDIGSPQDHLMPKAPTRFKTVWDILEAVDFSIEEAIIFVAYATKAEKVDLQTAPQKDRKLLAKELYDKCRNRRDHPSTVG